METLSSPSNGADTDQALAMAFAFGFEQTILNFVANLSDETKLIIRAIISILILIVEIKLGLKLYSFGCEHYKKLRGEPIVTEAKDGRNFKSFKRTKPVDAADVGGAGGEREVKMRGRNISNQKRVDKVKKMTIGGNQRKIDRSIPVQKVSSKPRGGISFPSSPSPSSAAKNQSQEQQQNDAVVDDTEFKISGHFPIDDPTETDANTNDSTRSLGSILTWMKRPLSLSSFKERSSSKKLSSSKESKRKKKDTMTESEGFISYIKKVFYNIQGMMRWKKHFVKPNSKRQVVRGGSRSIEEEMMSSRKKDAV